MATSAEVTLEKVQEHLGASVQGSVVQLTDETLSSICDASRIRKVYKIPSPSAKKTTNGVHPSQQDQNQLETQVLGAIALRGAT